MTTKIKRENDAGYWLFEDGSIVAWDVTAEPVVTTKPKPHPCYPVWIHDRYVWRCDHCDAKSYCPLIWSRV